jgi:purine-binding chemotaxis protein CheW
VSAAAGSRPFRERVMEDESQVIAFTLGGELHGCDIQLVEEVVNRRRVHPLPDMPARLLGILRLRGELVPVLDVARMLDLELAGGEAQGSVLVLALGDTRVGIAVDAAEDVLTLTPADYRPAPLSGGERDQFVVGVARLGGRLLNLLDLEEMLRDQTALAG